VNRKKIIAVIAAALLAALAVAGCTSGNSGGTQQQENRQQAQDSASLVNNQPIPHFNWSQIRQTLIDAEGIAANGTQTTSFFFQQGDPDPVYTCPSIGVPVANTAQLSNPDQNYNSGYPNGGTSYPIAQMDPYGIYAPSASTGTYVICVDSAGKPYLEYWEGDVMSVTAAATWDSTTHTVHVVGAPTAVIHTQANK